jgi:hypothetical protein
VQLYRFLSVSLVSFPAITLRIASQRVLIVVAVVVCFVIDSIRKLLDTPSYITANIFISSHIGTLNEAEVPFWVVTLLLS